MKTPKSAVTPSHGWASRLRNRIDKGLTGDKISWPDPAAAPLGTDDEAGSMGPPPPATPNPVLRSKPEEGPPPKRIKGPIPNRGLARFNDDHAHGLFWSALVILLAAFLGLELL